MFCFLELVEDPAVESVGIETFDATDDISVRRATGVNRHEQVKERSVGSTWTPAALVSQGVIAQFIAQIEADPRCEVLLFTASDATAFRESAERAKNASGNHGQDDPGRRDAEDEWTARLKGNDKFVTELLEKFNAAQGKRISRSVLFNTLAKTLVQDSSGQIDQLRSMLVTRLRYLLDDPRLAADSLEALEGLARNAAIKRQSVRQIDVVGALRGVGAQLLAATSAVLDLSGYRTRIERESTSVDIAQLPRLAPTLRAASGEPIQQDALPRRTLLIGGHGAGKTRLAMDLTGLTLAADRPCLHVRLARRATTFTDLLLAELSTAAQRHASPDDLDRFLARNSCALVLDGFDEVPWDDRRQTEREIAQLANLYPAVRVVVTSRPGSTGLIGFGFEKVDLCPLASEQVDAALGVPLHTLHLPDAVNSLASNPLMLGILVKEVAAGGRPRSEQDLLNAFIAETVSRQAQRSGGIDTVSGHRVAEDIAFAWLSTGRIALHNERLRGLLATVAKVLEKERVLVTSAPELEKWITESGFVGQAGPDFVPAHRAIFDHLAGRSMSRREPIALVKQSALREAIARYLGGVSEISESVISLLSAVEDDVELLARAQRLVRPEIDWPFPAERFAKEYLSALRKMDSGTFSGARLTSPAVTIEIDRDLTWISETNSGSNSDEVKVVDVPKRLYVVSKDGSTKSPVQGFRSHNHRGTEIDVRVPQFAALRRATDGVLERLREKCLLQEGPDIVYARLCSYAVRFVRTVTGWGSREYDGLSDYDLRGMTAWDLFSKLGTIVNGAIKGQSTNLAGVWLEWDPQRKTLVVAQDVPTSIAIARRGVHGAEFFHLFTSAQKLKIDDRPLHPLALLPESPTDPLLLLEGRLHRVKGEALQLFIARHELGEMRALRYLVENNLSGVSHLLRLYLSLPWRLEVVVEDLSDETTFDAHVKSHTDTNAESDAVVFVTDDKDESDRFWTTHSSIHAYRGVVDGAYRSLQSDVTEALSGSAALGADVL